jgi:hypothetical protein
MATMVQFVYGLACRLRCSCGELARTGVDAAFDAKPICGDCHRQGRKLRGLGWILSFGAASPYRLLLGQLRDVCSL